MPLNARFLWFAAGAMSAGVVMSAAWLLLAPEDPATTNTVSNDFNNAFAIHGPVESEWTRVHQLGNLDIWSDEANTSLAVTEDGRAVQMLTTEDTCCIFDIYEYGEYKATIRYGNFDQRLMSQGEDQRGIIWTYVDMGINGTIDFRYKEGIADSAQQVIMTEFAGNEIPSTELAEKVSETGW